MATLKDTIDVWLEGVEADLIKNYDRLGLRASGQWANSLEPFDQIEPTQIKLGMLGADYTKQLEQGRGPTSSTTPGSPTLRQVIRQWIDDKGIVPQGDITRDSLAFLIARKIHEQGIKVPNKYNAGGLVADVVTKQRIAELNRSIALLKVDQVRSEIIKEFR